MSTPLYEIKKPLLKACLLEGTIPEFIDPTLTLYEFLEVAQLGQGYIWARSERLVRDRVFWNIETDSSYQNLVVQYLKDNSFPFESPDCFQDWDYLLANAIEKWIGTALEDLIDFGYIKKIGVHYA